MYFVYREGCAHFLLIDECYEGKLKRNSWKINWQFSFCFEWGKDEHQIIIRWLIVPRIQQTRNYSITTVSPFVHTLRAESKFVWNVMFVNSIRDSSIWMLVEFSPAQFHVQWKVSTWTLNRMNKSNVIRTARTSYYILPGTRLKCIVGTVSYVRCYSFRNKNCFMNCTVFCVFIFVSLFILFVCMIKTHTSHLCHSTWHDQHQFYCFAPFLFIFFFAFVLFRICRLCFVFIMFELHISLNLPYLQMQYFSVHLFVKGTMKFKNIYCTNFEEDIVIKIIYYHANMYWFIHFSK